MDKILHFIIIIIIIIIIIVVVVVIVIIAMLFLPAIMLKFISSDHTEFSSCAKYWMKVFTVRPFNFW